MEGPEGASARVTAWLAERVPARLRILESRYTMPAGALPDPVLVIDHETGPLALEEWPAIIVTPIRLDAMAPVEQALDDGSEVHRCTYLVEAHLWVRASSYADTDQLRKRYALAVREALLERKQLAARQAYGTPPPGGPEFAVDPNRLREDYSPVLTDDAKRTIAGARVDLAVTVVESLAGAPPMGTVDTPPTVDVEPGSEVKLDAVVHPGLM